MKALLISALLLSAQVAFAYDEPDNFRGLKWGASLDEARSLFGTLWADRNRLYSMPIPRLEGTGRLNSFYFHDSMAEFRVYITLRFLDDKFVNAQIDFHPRFFPTVEAAFKERYGQPTSEQVKPIQNHAGATFDNKQLFWGGENVTISLDQYLTKLTEGSGSISQKAYLDYLRQVEKEKGSAAAKGL